VSTAGAGPRGPARPARGCPSEWRVEECG